MPVTVPVLQTRLQANFAARQIAGAKSKDLALGIATGFVQYLPTLPVLTADVGVIGAGTSVGSIIQLVPPTGTEIILGSLKAVGITGSKVRDLASAVSLSVATSMLQDAQVNTAVAGVAIGSGFGSFVSVPPPPLIGTLQASLRGFGINGIKVTDLAVGLGNGIASFLQTAVITTVDAGSPVPFGQPSGGAGTGNVT